MIDRKKIHMEMETKLAEGRAALDKLKAQLKEKGHEAHHDVAHAVAEAERTLEKGKVRLGELAAATDEEFEKAWSDTRDTWHSVSHDLEHGWHQLTDKVKTFLA
jgi:ElaB/YqjD/DUF883 family membrane-anchored ribosome-binding protein